MKAALYSLAVVVSLSLTSCLKSNVVAPTANQSRSNLSIGLSMKDAPKDIASIVGLLSRSGYDTLENSFIISGDSAECEFDDIAVGSWHLQVNAYDERNALEYSGSTDVEVLSGQTTPVNLVLDPATGSISVTVRWGTGKAGNALTLDGLGSYMEATNSTSLSSPDTAITLEAWVKPSMQYYNAVVVKGTWSYFLDFAEGLNPGIILYGTRIVDSTSPNYYWGRLMVYDPVPADQWTHVAITYSQSTGIRVYLNAQLVYQGPGSGTIQSGSMPLRVGARVDTLYPEYYKGQIDEVRIWNVVRSQSDISQNMAVELTGTETGLVAYYKFDEPTGSTLIHDATANHNDGHLHGNSALVSSTAF